MREILFRGKPLGKLDEKGFVYGSLGVIGSDLMAIYHCHEFTEDDITLVDLGTVGQFTGLLDENGTKIFEGDIIQNGNYRFCVEYEAGIAGFIARWPKPTNWTPCMNRGSMLSYEVIGNIHDNPELLK